jgi:hypothetical protein
MYLKHVPYDVPQGREGKGRHPLREKPKNHPNSTHMKI